MREVIDTMRGKDFVKVTDKAYENMHISGCTKNNETVSLSSPQKFLQRTPRDLPCRGLRYCETLVNAVTIQIYNYSEN